MTENLSSVFGFVLLCTFNSFYFWLLN